jgi:hypothetical protein
VDHHSKAAPANSSQDPILKYPTQNRAGRMTQVIECLPSKFKTGVQNPMPQKKKR